jgi:Mg2+ and Co2+ transporter CorA
LSFVTGIFGMNVAEINGSPLSVWVAVVSLVIIIAGTAAIFWGLKLREDYQAKRGKSKMS